MDIIKDTIKELENLHAMKQRDGGYQKM